MSLRVEITKRVGGFTLDAAFEASDETIALLGASGCGKSMTLRCIAGVARPDSGVIVADGTTLFDSAAHIDLPPQRREVGMMFQHCALFPNMSVRENVEAGAARLRGEARRSAVREAMESFELEALADRLPHQLSGGQQQRVALARIVASSPRVLLLDEPLSALDSHLRFRTEQTIRALIQRLGRTTVLVSHDRDEVYRLADSVAVMADGRVERAGAKADVFASPGTRSAAVLTGCKNISRAEQLGPSRLIASDWGIELDTSHDTDGVDSVGIRMHDIRAPRVGDANIFRCAIESVTAAPFSIVVMLRPHGADGPAIGWETSREDRAALGLAPGGSVDVALPAESLLLLRG